MRNVGFILTRDYEEKTLRDIIFYNWVYYSYDCPLWRERIHKFGGYKCSVKKEIIFDNDDMFDEFYDTYNVEPDEQPRETFVYAYGDEFFNTS